MALQKNYIVKVYDQDGTSLKLSVPPNTVKALPEFRAKTNGGFGELVLQLKYPFDNWDNTIFKANAIVDLWCFDDANQLGRRIYRGYISKWGCYVNGDDEGVEITCLGLFSLMQTSYHARLTPVTFTAQDPRAIFEAMIDSFNASWGGSLIQYTHGVSTQAVGTNVSASYTDLTWLAGCDKAIAYAPNGWYYLIDQNGLASFKVKPSTPTHRFMMNKHITKLDAPQDAETVYNDFELRWGSVPTILTDNDAASQATYGQGAGTPSGKRTQIVTDSTITSSGAAAQWMATAKAYGKDAKVKVNCTVNTNYDLESIHVGDTCSIFNYLSTFSFFPSNMLIVALTYKGDSVDLELQQQQQDFMIELQSYVKGV